MLPENPHVTRHATHSLPEIWARDDVFIETKIWISDYGYDQTLHAFGKSAGKLGVDRIDLLILHQALPARFDLTQEAYRALETLLADGRVRAIGVSNFMPGHLDALLTQATVIPAVNQVEVHPYFTQPAVGRAQPDHSASPPQFSAQIAGSYVRKEWKITLREQLLQVRHAVPAAGPIGMTISIITGPGRNWANLWKPLIDAFGPVLGENPEQPFHPNDDRITSLGLHHNVNTAIGHDVIITAWWMNL